MDYWTLFWKKFCKDFATATGEQMIGLLLAVGILGFQIRYGVIHAAEVRGSYLAIAWPYLFLGGCLFLWHLLRTPYLLHKETVETLEREHKIAIANDRIEQAKLQAAIPSKTDWMNLASHFKSLPYVTANWESMGGNTKWTISDSVCKSFCIMAGETLLQSKLIENDYPLLLSEPDPLKRWLNYVKEAKPTFEQPLRGEEDLPDGSKLTCYIGRIEVPKNSADVCIEFAALSSVGGAV